MKRQVNYCRIRQYYDPRGLSDLAKSLLKKKITERSLLRWSYR